MLSFPIWWFDKSIVACTVSIKSIKLFDHGEENETNLIFKIKGTKLDQNQPIFSMWFMPEVKQGSSVSQCACPWFLQPKPKSPWIFYNPNKKDHGLFHFYIAVIFKKDQNQLQKTSVIGLPEFTSINMAEKCHQWASFSIENPFFEDYSFGSPMRNGFFNWFWSVLHITAI